jgi:hypothetical protein
MAILNKKKRVTPFAQYMLSGQGTINIQPLIPKTKLLDIFQFASLLHNFGAGYQRKMAQGAQTHV